MSKISDWLDNLEVKGIKAIGKVQVSFSPPKILASHCRRAQELAAPGVIVARRYDAHLSSYMIPGTYSHSGVCESSQYMIHAVGEGVERIDILDFVKDTDGFILLKPRDPFDLDVAINWLRQQIGKDYDFKFNGEDASSLFCHETTAGFCNEGWKNHGLKIHPIRKCLAGMERDIFTADQFTEHSRITHLYEATP